MKKKFSKSFLIEVLQSRISTIEKVEDFTRSNGWNQVKGKGEETNRAYGKYTTLCNLLEEIANNNLTL